jgi:two-component system NtrC family sensor kinase
MAHLIFNPFAVPPVLAAFLNLALVVWIYAQGLEGRTRLIFILWNLALGLWNASIAIGYLITDPQAAFAWYKATIPLAIGFISPLFLHFVIELTESDSQKYRRAIFLGYLSGLLFAIGGSCTSLLMNGQVKRYFWGFYPLAGNGQWLFGLTLYALAGYAFWTLLQALRHATGYRRNQLEYVFAGAAIVFGCGATNFLPLYGINIYPIGNLTNSIYSLLVAYAIVEYGLMDIRLALKRGAVYGLLSGALTLVYLSIVSVFQRLFGHYGLNESYVYYTAAVPITIVLAPPVKARLEPLVERAPFWKTYQYTEIVKDFGSAVLTVLDLPTVAQRIGERMSALVTAESGAVYVRHSGSHSFFCAWSRGPKGSDEISDHHPVILDLQSHRSELSKEKALWEFQHENNKAEKQAPSSWLESWPYALTLPLFVKQRFLGVIALGEKASGDMFNADDIHLLKLLTDQAAVALSNALRVAEIDALQNALKTRHDNALMGILATEIAHEVTKPLTRIINERARLAGGNNKQSQESLDKIESEAQRAAEIMEGFALLSPHVELPLSVTALKDLLEAAVTTSGIAKDPEIQIERKYATLPKVPINPGQISQVLINIIQNAWHAMPQGGRLTLSANKGEVLMGDEATVEIRIEDTGSGIPADLQDRVFDPFFTTKQDVGGRGVGLTISRAMVERHGGSIHIKSPVLDNKGTCVIIQLPIKFREAVYEAS